MRIELRGVSKGRRGQSLQTTSIGFESGRATLARVETEQRPTVLGLIASGRMRPDTGGVVIDGRPTPGSSGVVSPSSMHRRSPTRHPTSRSRASRPRS